MRSASIGGVSNAPEVLHIACLCAAWCRLCDAYGEVLHAAQGETALSGVVLRWHWIDIEDEADLLGDFDVETFPTLVIVDPREVRFAGPLTPQPETLRRLLRATLIEAAPDAHWPGVPAPVQAFATRLRERSASN